METKPGAEDTLMETDEIRLTVEADLLDAVEGASIAYGESPDGLGFSIDAPNAPPPG